MCVASVTAASPIRADTSRSSRAIAVATPTSFSAPFTEVPATGIRKLWSTAFTASRPVVFSRRTISTPLIGARIAASTRDFFDRPSSTVAIPENAQPVASAPPQLTARIVPQWAASTVSPPSPNRIRVGATGVMVARAAAACTPVAPARVFVPPIMARVVSPNVKIPTEKPRPSSTFSVLPPVLANCVSALLARTAIGWLLPAVTPGSRLICTPSSTTDSQELSTNST